MIVDEFGGIAGLATLKQLLSVIVGPVGEEGQPLETQYASVDENTFLLDAGLTITQITGQLDLDLPLGRVSNPGWLYPGAPGPHPQSGGAPELRQPPIHGPRDGRRKD